MIREAAKAFARQIPAIDALIQQRDGLLREVADLKASNPLNDPYIANPDAVDGDIGVQQTFFERMRTTDNDSNLEMGPLRVD